MNAQILPIQKASPEVLFEVDAQHPLIPDDIYTAVCVGCDVKEVFKVAKVFLRFRIIEGSYAGTNLFRPYRAKGKKDEAGRFRVKLHRKGKLFLMLCRVLGLPKRTKAHHVSHRELVNKLCRVRTRTVQKDHFQKQLPPDEFYSVIEDIECVVAG